MSTQTISTEKTLPTIRRTDEVAARVEEARRFIAEEVNSLSRAEKGVIRSVVFPRGTDLYNISDAEYVDEYDPDDGYWNGRTRRLSDSARAKAIRSLFEKGYIRIEGIRPDEKGIKPGGSRGYHHGHYPDRYVYGAGNSGIEYYDGNSEIRDHSEWTRYDGVVAPQQIAAWYVGYLSGLVEDDPTSWFTWREIAQVKIDASDELAEAFRVVESGVELLRRVDRAKFEIEYLRDVEVAEVIKPDPADLFNAVSNAYSNARHEGKDVGEIYDAMNSALGEFYRAAKHGELPDNALTPENYVREYDRLVAEVAYINAKIEEVAS